MMGNLDRIILWLLTVLCIVSINASVTKTTTKLIASGKLNHMEAKGSMNPEEISPFADTKLIEGHNTPQNSNLSLIHI